MLVDSRKLQLLVLLIEIILKDGISNKERKRASINGRLCNGKEYAIFAHI
jgi:hypothetical protein